MDRTSLRRRAEVLRAVVGTADERRDGALPVGVDGVADPVADAGAPPFQAVVELALDEPTHGFRPHGRRPGQRHA